MLRSLLQALFGILFWDGWLKENRKVPPQKCSCQIWKNLDAASLRSWQAAQLAIIGISRLM